MKLYLDESLLAEIEYQKFVVQNSIKVSSQMVNLCGIKRNNPVRDKNGQLAVL